MIKLGMRFWVKPVFLKSDKVGAVSKTKEGKVVYIHPKGKFAVLEFEGVCGTARESFPCSELTEQNIVREKKNKGGK